METGYVQIPASGSEDVDGASSKLRPLPAYNPASWRETLFVLKGRPFLERGTRSPLLVLWAVGIGLVVMSALVGVTLEENDRKCRAWCSEFSLGPQPHQYIGVCLFLLMGFRSNQSYQRYEAGLTAWTSVRREIWSFTTVLLSMIPRRSMSPEQRLRMLSFAAAFPYLLFAELNEERVFPSATVDELLQPQDLLRVKQASSMPMMCVMELTEMIRDYTSPKVPGVAVKMMNKSVQKLVGALTDATRIKHNPVAFAYIAHLRLLLCIYLAALPLALVESLGWSTIPVFMVISYALLSLETIAVEIQGESQAVGWTPEYHALCHWQMGAAVCLVGESPTLLCFTSTMRIALHSLTFWIGFSSSSSSPRLVMTFQDPFGKQANDLRIDDYNLEIRDGVGEMWRAWVRNKDFDPPENYKGGFEIRHCLQFANEKDRYTFW